MDPLTNAINTFTSKKEPCANDIVALLNVWAAMDGSEYRSVESMKTAVQNGTRIRIEAQSGVAVQLHCREAEKDDSGALLVFFDLFMPNPSNSRDGEPLCHATLSSDLSAVKSVYFFKAM